MLSGATVGVYLDNSTTPLVTGTATGTTISLTPTGSATNVISDGQHTFTVKEGVNAQAITLYTDWEYNPNTGSYGPGTQFPIAAGSVLSNASGGATITIGFEVLAQPVSEARVRALYTYTVQTNAPAGDTVTVTPVSFPPGMTFNGTSTFTWTPTSSQLNTSPTFEATVTDSQGRTDTIGPVGITVVVGADAHGGADQRERRQRQRDGDLLRQQRRGLRQRRQDHA